MTSLDFAKVVYRLGIDVADTTADPDDKPDVIWLDGGRVIITPKQFEKKVPEPPTDVSPDPFTLLGFAYEADIDSDGYLSHGGEQQITVIDLTSPKVNPRFDDPNASTHTVSFTGLTATIPGVGPVAIAMQPRDVRITKDGPDGSGINDLTLVSPVVPGAATPIYQGPQGVSVETLEVSTEGSLVATLSNGTEVDAGPIPGTAEALAAADTATEAASTATDKATVATNAATDATTAKTDAEAAQTDAQTAKADAEAARADLLAQKGSASGIAPLDSGSRVPQANLPTHLDPIALTASMAQQQRNLDLFRAAVRAGKITATHPLVPIGDSHTDSTTAAQYLWQQITNYRTQPGEGLEGLATAALVPKGANGQTLSYYLANLAQVGGFNDAMALAPHTVMPCWLTNDVRQGALGLTTDAIRSAGAALLNQLVALIKANANRPEFIILRVPAPYTTVNTGTDNYINDGAGNINPAGLAQIYTDGVRLAYYDVLAQHPDLLLYDPQTRLFGVTSPTSNDNANGYFGNQIHQSQKGYWAEGDDFAAWVDAAQPRKEGRAFEARRTTPLTPWTAYYREPEDTSRYVLIGEGIVTTDRPDISTFIDIGPSFPGLAPGNILAGDIVEIVGAKSAFQIPTSSTITAQGTNTRIVLGSGTVGVAVAYQHKVKVWRRKASPTDVAFNSILEDTTYQTKLVGRVVGSGNSGNTFVTINSTSINGGTVQGLAKDWVYRITPGDKLYVEGFGTTVVRTLGSGDFVQQGNSVRILNVADTGHSYNADDGLLAVIVGTHADAGFGKDTANSVSASSMAQTIPDPATGPKLNAITLTGNCTLTFPTSVIGRRFDLVLTQDATGSRTVTWPSGVKWAAATAPTLTTTAAKKDWFRFVYDGSSWLGEVVAQNL